jgi:hypothetical protein
MCVSTQSGCFSPRSLSNIAHLANLNRFRGGGFGSVVWTTDSSRVGMRFSPGLESTAMSDSNDRRYDQKRELECLRLASDLRQMAKETLAPDLKAHCLRMAKHWSGQGDEPPAKDDTGFDRDPVH